MKLPILMSIMLTFGFYFSSQLHSQRDEDLELRPLLQDQRAKAGPGLTWRDVELPLYDFYAETLSCQSCYDSMSDDRCSCVGCVAGGICASLFTGCVAAVSCTAYYHDQIQKCIASCGRGYQGLGWCTPDNTCFPTYKDCESSCDPSGNAYAIGLYSSLAGLVVTGAVTVSLCFVPCRNLVKYCKHLDVHNNGVRKRISKVRTKYKDKEDEPLLNDDIKSEPLSTLLQEGFHFLTEKLNKQQKEALDSIENKWQ